MRRTSPHHTDVFSHLPALLLRALDTEEVGQVLDELVAAGWRPGQLRHRVGAEPAQGSAERDAAHLLAFLRALRDQPCPDVLHAREVEQRAAERRQQDAEAPVPASPQVVAEHVAQIRAELKGVPRRREERAPRTRPACSLCAGEGSYFVTRDVHLCRRCVDVLATGQVRLTEQTG
jgi:ribosomal protein S14